MSRRWLAAAISGMIVGGWGATASAQDGTVVLDATGYWRMFHVLKPPLIQTKDGLKATVREVPLNAESAPPPADWIKPDFDDGDWGRGPASRTAQTPYLERLCLRGKFAVSDPAAVKGLKLTVRYHGGVTVWINGVEVKKAHLPPPAAGGKKDTPLAEPYPAEVFVDAKGKVLPAPESIRGGGDDDTKRRIALRDREIADLEIPAKSLRKGVNVLAIEILRAPYDQVHWAEDKTMRLDRPIYQIGWYTCELRHVRLTAAGAAGLTPNAVRPDGFQAWNSQLLATDFDLDFGDPNEPLRPVRLVGARNGAFSGKVVFGSTKPIKGLKATATDLKGAGGGGAIPAAAVQVRYGMPWGAEQFVPQYLNNRVIPYPASPRAIGALFEVPPAEIPVGGGGGGRNCFNVPGQPAPVPGAVASVWATVHVPPEAKPGTYEGTLRLKADGEKEVAVPLKLTVADYTLPDPGDWRTWVELLQSPDTLAIEYDKPLWSDEHFQLIGQSLRLMGEAGCRFVTVPLICGTHYGNDETMVRWLDQGGGKYDWDFTVMERYLDVVERSMGKPKIVAFYVWDVFLIPAKGGAASYGKEDTAASARETRHSRVAEALRGQLGKGPRVSMAKKGGAGVEVLQLPTYEDPASKAIWKALFTQLRAKLKARGLEGAMMLGVMSDGIPSREQCVFFNEVSGNLPWASHSHTMFPLIDGKYQIYGISEIGFMALNERFWVMDPIKDNGRGWSIPNRRINAPAVHSYDSYPPTSWRHIMEYTLAAGFNGIRLKGDMWAAIKDKSGRRLGYINDRYPEASWRNLNMPMSALAPGPDGPVATTRLEIMREGLQECEARILIEQGLLKNRLGAKGKACEAALNERSLAIWKAVNYLQMDNPVNFQWFAGAAGHLWYLGSGWQDRTEKLFTLAGDAAKAMGAKYAPSPNSPREKK